MVSARWGTECVRLRVVVKSDNCGEGQDCSGKGVCFSNISMVSVLRGFHILTIYGVLYVICKTGFGLDWIY